MKLIPLRAIRDAAVSAAIGWPRDKACLMRRLKESGAQWTEGRVKNGQIGRLYGFDSLPRDLREALGDLAGVSVPVQAAPPERFQSVCQSLKNTALRRLRLVEKVSRLIRAGSTSSAIATVAAEASVPRDTLKRYWTKVSRRPSHEWLEILTPCNKGRQRDEIDPLLWQAFLKDYGRVERPQLRAVWERVKKLADRHGLRCPHEKTFQRRFKALSGGVQIQLRQGDRALADSFPHRARDRSGMLPLESVNSDGREWDIRVLWPDGSIRRPVVTLAEDDATHFVVAYEIDVVESEAGYRRLYERICRSYGIPWKMRHDNTRAAANKGLTAGAKGRKRFKDRWDDLDGLYKELGTETSFAEVANGKTKGAERVFAEIKERTEKHPDCAGAYTGRSPSEKPANYGEKAVPLEVFERVLREEVERYNTTTRTRSTVVPVGFSYASAFELGLKRAKPRKLTALQDVLFLAKKRLRPNAAGEVFLGVAPQRHRYWCLELQDYAVRHPGVEVVARYDQDDLSKPLHVEDRDGRCIARAPRLEAGAFNSAAQAAEHRRERKRFLKAHKEKLASELRMEEIAAADQASHEPEPEAPTPIASPTVVTGRFGNKQAVPQAAPEPIFTKRDPAKLAAAHAALSGEPPFEPTADGPDYERARRGEEILARWRAR